METSTLHGLATLSTMAAFISIVIWAYGSKRKQYFEDAARSPFADDTDATNSNRGTQHD